MSSAGSCGVRSIRGARSASSHRSWSASPIVPSTCSRPPIRSSPPSERACCDGSETSLLAIQPDNGRALVKLEESPFYAEGGGQVADSGEVRWDGGSARVADVYRVGDDQAVELDRPVDGLAPGTRVEAEVDHVA